MKIGTKVHVRIGTDVCMGTVQERHWNEDTHDKVFRVAIINGSQMSDHLNSAGELWVNLCEMMVLK